MPRMHSSHVHQLVLVPVKKNNSKKCIEILSHSNLLQSLNLYICFSKSFLFSYFIINSFISAEWFETDGGLFYFIMTNNVTKSIIFYYSNPLSQLILKILFRCPT